jgi:pimeloyl-ACP methyl ester carboxylesterase
MMDHDLTSTTVESFLLSIASLRRTDLRPMLPQLKIPVMGMFGERDNIVNSRQWQPLLAGVPHAKIVRWERAQHFIMLDTPQDFMENLKTFLDQEETPAK